MSCVSLASSTLLMDDYGGSYRYHALLRDFLQRELAVREPDLVTTVHRRAAAWYHANDAIERAVDHAFAADDPDLVATLVGNGFVRYHWSGHRATIRAWARRLGVGCSGGPPVACRAGSLGGDRRGRCRSDDPFRGRRRAGSVRGQRHLTARRPSRPAEPCSEPAWSGRAPTTRWRTPPGRSSSKGTLARGGTSRCGSWPSRASRSAIWRARTRPWPTRSSRPDRPATSRSCIACSGTARLWPPNRAPGMPLPPWSPRATRSTRLRRSTGTSRASRRARPVSG